MAVFRKINVSFWDDEKVVDDFTPEDRYFMLYLMTNTHTNQIGCYQITLRQMEFETGYNKETILKLISRFENVLKVIKFSESTKEILILNWHKYNWTNSPKILACLSKEFKSIKNREFRYYIHTVSIEYGYCIDTESQEEEEKEKEEEQEELKEEEQEEDSAPAPENLSLENWYGFYKNVHLTSNQYGRLLSEIANQSALDEIIEDLSSNIAQKKEKSPPYDEKFPDMHFATLKAYWKYRKLNGFKKPIPKEDKAKALKEELDKLTEHFRQKELNSG